MATRLYGVAATAAPVSPAFDAGWQSTSGAVRRSLSTTKAAGTETRSAVSVTSGSGNETLAFQLIGAPLNAGSISGTVTIVTRGNELATSDNIGARVRCIKVFSNDGSTVRGTLLTLGNHTTTTEMGTSAAGYPAASATALSSVSAQAGDRIVVELGYGMTTTGTSPQYDMVIGGNGTDHANSNGDTTGTVPWVEFSQTLSFQVSPLTASASGTSTSSGSATAGLLLAAGASGGWTSDGAADATVVAGGGVAAPLFGSAGTYLTGTASTANVAVPSGVAAGDIIVVVVYASATTTVTALASGFAQATGSPQSPTNQTQRLYVMWKRATGADTGTYDFTMSASDFREAVAVRYTGAIASGDPWDDVDAAAQDRDNGTNTPAVSVDTTGTDRLLIFAATYWAGQAWTAPTGFTERVDAGGGQLTVDDKAQAAAGSSGNVSTTIGSSSFSSTAWLGALKPAAGGGTTHSGSASGTATSSGAATITVQLAATTSGASTSAGSAAVRVILAAAASGACVSSGSAAGGRLMAVTAAGNCVSAGSAAAGQLMVATASGTATSTGTAAITLTLAAGTAGTAVSAGSATLRLLMAVLASGTATSAGAAAAGLRMAAAASGAVVSVGSAAATIPGSFIERPNTGTITRPNTGTVTRPDTGVVSRP